LDTCDWVGLSVTADPPIEVSILDTWVLCRLRWCAGASSTGPDSGRTDSNCCGDPTIGPFRGGVEEPVDQHPVFGAAEGEAVAGVGGDRSLQRLGRIESCDDSDVEVGTSEPACGRDSVVSVQHGQCLGHEDRWPAIDTLLEV